MLQQRLPSGMQGDKNTFESDGSSGAGMEGSLRNHLAVWGPGVPSGGVSNTLLSLADVLPTIAELADATNTTHEPWVSKHVTWLTRTPCSTFSVQHSSTLWTQGLKQCLRRLHRLT
jgi:arylsulfatase A-like enzyme